MESINPTNRKGRRAGKVGSNCKLTKQRKKPKKANLTKTPLRKIEKFVEASTWAFGNHPQNGHSGSLTPNPTNHKQTRKFKSNEEKEKRAMRENKFYDEIIKI